MTDHDALQPQNSPLAQALLARIRAHAAARGISAATVCTLAVNDGKFAARLEAGKTCSVATFEKFMAWLDRSESAAGQGERAA